MGQGALLPNALPDGLVRGTVRKIVFSNPEKGFYVLQVLLDGGVPIFVVEQTRNLDVQN